MQKVLGFRVIRFLLTAIVLETERCISVAKLYLSKGNLMSLDTSHSDSVASPVDSAATEVEKALDEIDAGAAAATAALAEHDGTLVAADGESLITKDQPSYDEVQAKQLAGKGSDDRPKMTREERRSVAIAKAKKQQEVGARALSKEFVGAVSLPYQVVINDLGIASSFVRFVALLDQSLYTINRFGANAFSRAEINLVVDRFKKLIDDYANDAKSNLSAAQERVKQARSELLDESDWMQPDYQKHAQEMRIQIKHPLTRKFVEGMMNFDKAIYAITVLEWNDGADQAEASRQRENERRQSRVIFYLAARTLLGMRKKTFEGLLDGRRTNRAPKQEKSGESETAAAESIAPEGVTA
jgi:hypothetical protein